MKWAGRLSAPVAQALRWLGRDAAANAEVVSTLRQLLPDPVKRDLFENSRDLPGWAATAGAPDHDRSGCCRMRRAFEAFLTLPEQDKRDVFDAAAGRARYVVRAT